jgi:hypothetical protein
MLVKNGWRNGTELLQEISASGARGNMQWVIFMLNRVLAAREHKQNRQATEIISQLNRTRYVRHSFPVVDKVLQYLDHKDDSKNYLSRMYQRMLYKVESHRNYIYGYDNIG